MSKDIRKQGKFGAAAAVLVCLPVLFCILLLSPASSDAPKIAALPGLSHKDAMKEENLQKIGKYQILVIDAWEYSAEEISALKKQGCKVYTYLNVGSLENFRPYYDEYKNLCLLPYEGWPDESWVDVTDASWQGHCVSLAGDYLAKGIDGFFLDNVDVCMELEENRGFEKGPAESGIEAILTGIRGLEKESIPVILNGGTDFLDYEFSSGKRPACDGICLESVYTEVTDYEKNGSKAVGDAEVREKTKTLQSYQDQGLSVWDIEYTKNRLLAASIRRKAARNGWSLYISSSYALGRPE